MVFVWKKLALEVLEDTDTTYALFSSSRYAVKPKEGGEGWSLDLQKKPK